jgi:predicted membrane chloride channel (bestrophin family)
MTVDYDTTKGIIMTALTFKSTVIPLVMAKPEFYMLLGLNLGIGYARRAGLYDPDDYHMTLAMGLTGVTGSLMTFFVVFYNGNVFSRYQKLYELTKGMSENCLYICSIIDKDIKNKALQRKLLRWLLASCFVFFFERTGEGGGDGVADSEFQQLANLGLITAEEVKALKNHGKTMKHWAIPSFVLLHWSMKLYRVHTARIADLDKTYFVVRKCQEDVVEMLELPMPFQYYHIMNLMLMLNLCLWAYSLALVDTYFAPVIFFFVQLMFQGMRELSIALADPYGTDETDFPLNEWMTGLYMRIHAIAEDEFDCAASVKLEDMPPLHQLTYGQNIIDVLDDSKLEGIGENADKTAEWRAAKKKSEAGKKVADTKKAEDQSGDYKALPVDEPAGERKSKRHSKEEHHEDDEEEDDGD